MTRTSPDVPLVDLTRPHAMIAAELAEEFERIFASMQLFLGPNVHGFQEDFASYLGVRHCVGVSDGTEALYLALRALDVGPGDEVITVSHTFFATVEAIMLVGATPVFVDVDPVTFTIDVTQLERAVTPRTKALLPVHLYGLMANMDGIMMFAKKNGLRVVEDTSQAHGATRDGRTAGTVGDIGTFSFYYSKNLGAYGEAGGVVTNDDELAQKVAALRDHGSHTRYHHDEVGVNGRLDEVQAAVLKLKLPHLNTANELRRANARLYSEKLRALPVLTPELFGDDHVFHLYVVRTPERDQLQTYLKNAGVHTGIHYPVPCHRQPALSGLARTIGDLPVTERIVGEILSLPMFPELTEQEINRVIDGIDSFFASRRATSFVAAS
jgi:dTDP-4-amino-4,6-dideoxygalactose transaminase